MMALTIFRSCPYDSLAMDWRDKAKSLIKKSGHAQYWFAEQLSLEPYELSRYLSKQSNRRMPVDMMLALAKALNVPPATFFSEDEVEDLFLKIFYDLEKEQKHLAIKFFDSIKKSSEDALG
jgi:transcriptional regulator with XRE-family HTH domain